MKNKLYTFAVSIIALIFAYICGFFLPKLLLDKNAASNEDVIIQAPEEMYLASGTAMAKKASENLSPTDRIKLVTGVWDSSCIECTPDEYSEAYLTEADAVLLAKEQIEALYHKRAYPLSLSSNYGNWYSWSTRLFKYTDNIFNTYVTYVWEITFLSYENNIKHTVLMTENGTIINAEVNKSFSRPKTLYGLYTENDISDILLSKDVSMTGSPEKAKDSNPYIYPDTLFTQAESTNIYSLKLLDNQRGTTDTYYVYQYFGKSYYGIGITLPIPEQSDDNAEKQKEATE